jgi:hypothetical protein
LEGCHQQQPLGFARNSPLGGGFSCARCLVSQYISVIYVYRVHIFHNIHMCVYIYTYTYTPNSTCTCITFHLLRMPLRFLLSHQPGVLPKRRFAPMLPKVGVFTTHKLQPHNLEASHANHEKNNGIQFQCAIADASVVGKIRPKIFRHYRWLECSQTSTCGTMWLRFTLIRSVPRV